MCSLVPPLITHMFRIWKARSSLYVMLSGTLHGGGIPQSFNRYAYVQGDPVNFVDPTGLEAPLTCLVDGMPTSCAAASGLLNSGAGILTGIGGFNILPPGTFVNPRGELVYNDRIHILWDRFRVPLREL